MLRLRQEHRDQNEDDATRDRTVGEIKCPPSIQSPTADGNIEEINIEEVDDFTEPDTVGDVADCAAGDKGERDRQDRFVAIVPDVEEQQGEDEAGDDEVGGRRAKSGAHRPAVVVHERQPEEITQHLDRAAFSQKVEGPQLGCLVENTDDDNDHRRPDQAVELIFGQLSPLPLFRGTQCRSERAGSPQVAPRESSSHNSHSGHTFRR